MVLVSHPVIYVNWYGAMEYCKWLSDTSQARTSAYPVKRNGNMLLGGEIKARVFPYAGGHKLKEVGWYPPK